MKSLWGQYIEEREGAEIIEYYDSDGIEQAFGSYRFETLADKTEALYLVDVFVRSDSRRLGLCSKIVKDVTEIASICDGCKSIITSADLRAKGATESIAVILSCGFKVSFSEGPMLYFKKDL